METKERTKKGITASDAGIHLHELDFSTQLSGRLSTMEDFASWGFIHGDATMPTVDANEVVSGLDDKHAWAIFLDPALVIASEDGGKKEHFLVGYENGLAARRNETHFKQKETDPISHRIFFQPEPCFISYSFFYGFFGETITRLCEQMLSTGNMNLSNRRVILYQFCEKYTFAFPKHKYLEDTMREYAATMIGNVLDVQAKVGNVHAK